MADRDPASARVEGDMASVCNPMTADVIKAIGVAYHRRRPELVAFL
jgi:hypothetical protein